jgi:hypothetical protein
MTTSTNQATKIPIPPGLADALREFPTVRNVEHCGKRFTANPLAIYAYCPQCQAEIKVRAFSAVDELEDVIDAVLQWMNNPAAAHAAEQRAAELREDED